MKKVVVLAMALAGLLWAVASTGPAYAESTWVDGNSNWNTPGNWNPAIVPDSSATDVLIIDGASTVTLDAGHAFSVGNLQLAGGNALTTGLNAELLVYGGSIKNAGAITLNGGSATNSFLILNNNTTPQDGGTLTLSTAGGGGSAYIIQGVGGLTLTNADNTIQGNGIIGNGGLALSNAGTVNANVSGAALTLNGSGGITNTNLLEATNNGVLQLSGATVNNAGGNITAAGGSTVQLFGSTVIQGGTLTNNGGAFFGTPINQIAFLDGSTGSGPVTINGTYTSDLGTDTYLLGTINNKGNIQVNGGSAVNSALLLNANTTLQGGGTLTLSTAGGGGSAYIEQGVGGLTLTNLDNTIQGNGIIGNNGLALSNAGTVNANVPGQALTLQSIGITNTNLLEATNNGVLQLSGATVNNAGGNITAAGGSTVQLFGSTVIQGGTLTNNGGAFFGTPVNQTAFLDGSTGSGAVTINGTYTSDLGTDTYLTGTIINKGNIQVNGGSATNSALILNGSTTLQGGGTLTLSTAGGGGSAYITAAAGGLTLTNDTGHTIQGGGNIGQGIIGLVNKGAIIANAGFPLYIQTATLFDNEGTLRTVAGSAMDVIGGFTQSSGLTAVDGSLFATTIGINGGILSGSGQVFGDVAVGPGGTVQPGNSPGVLTINGNYTSTGVLAIAILNLAGGPGAGYSQLNVTGTGGALDSGTLQINLLAGTVLNKGEEFDIFHAAGGYTGTFASITGASSYFTELYTPTDVFLVAAQDYTAGAVPVPPSLFLLAPGLAGLLGGRRWLAGRRG